MRKAQAAIYKLKAIDLEMQDLAEQEFNMTVHLEMQDLFKRESNVISELEALRDKSLFFIKPTPKTRVPKPTPTPTSEMLPRSMDMIVAQEINKALDEREPPKRKPPKRKPPKQ